MHVSIVVPIYNELENLPLLHAAIMRVMEPLQHSCELILINDGSTDGSTEVMDQIAGADSRVKLIEFRKNFGQTAAMQAGIQAATGDVIVTIDGDLQNEPEDIPMMLAKIEEGYDLVHGWRKNRQDAVLHRKLPSICANWLIGKVTGFPVHDLGCTLKAIRSEIAKELQLYGEMHRFIPILARQRGARCIEVVTRHHARRFGVSKYGLGRVTRVLLDLATVKYLIQYAVSPMKLFGMMGLMAMFTSGLAAFASIGLKLAYNYDMTGNPLLLLSAVSGLAAIQFVFLGLLSELCSRIYFQVQNVQTYAVRKTTNFETVSLAISPAPALDPRSRRAA